MCFKQEQSLTQPLRFTPELHGADETLVGIGNQHTIYNQLAYRVSDGQTTSDEDFVQIHIDAQANAPRLSLGTTTHKEVLFKTRA